MAYFHEHDEIYGCLKLGNFITSLATISFLLAVHYLSLPFQLHRVCSVEKYGICLPQTEENLKYLLGLPAPGTELEDVTSRTGSTGGQHSVLHRSVGWDG
jgi:hypothetical protein